MQRPANTSHQSLNFSSLRTTPKRWRWSMQATLVYSVTICAIMFLFTGLVTHPTEFVAHGVVAAIAILGAIQSRAMFRVRGDNPPSIDDLDWFARDNNFDIVHLQPSSNLSDYVRIQLAHYPFGKGRYIPWHFAIRMALHGTYRGHTISLYSLTPKDPTFPTSPIEEDILREALQREYARASITLSTSIPGSPAIMPGACVIIWDIPHINPDDLRRLQRAVNSSTFVDLQTDGKSLAILLDTNIPYDRQTAIEWFAVLDVVADTLGLA